MRCEMQCILRLLDMFRTVFPYRNKTGRLIMDTEKVHSIIHCGIEICSVANPMNASCEAPEKAHTLWVKGQGGNTNQGPSAALTMMRHTVNKEASQMLCRAVQARAEDIDEEEWLDKEGNPLRADRWWHASSIEEAGESHGPCMGMQVNIWERAKYRRYMQHFLVGGGKHAGGYDALNHQAILHGDAGKLGKLDILSVLPEKVAIFLYEYHDFRFASMKLPGIPDDRSGFSVHDALQPDQA